MCRRGKLANWVLDLKTTSINEYKRITFEVPLTFRTNLLSWQQGCYKPPLGYYSKGRRPKGGAPFQTSHITVEVVLVSGDGTVVSVLPESVEMPSVW